mgnify:FL=1
MCLCINYENEKALMVDVAMWVKKVLKSSPEVVKASQLLKTSLINLQNENIKHFRMRLDD